MLVLSFGLVAHVSRLTRSSMLEVLDSRFVLAARARGLPERRVLWRHALPNALLPAITVLAIDAGLLIGGIVVVETVFAYPGLGRLLVFAIERHDLPLLQVGMMVVTAIYALANFVAELLLRGAEPAHPRGGSGGMSVLALPRLRVPSTLALGGTLAGADRHRFGNHRHLVHALRSPAFSVRVRLQPPSALHPFGTDEFGRDVLSRVLAGAHLSLATGFGAMAISLLIGVPLGLLAAFHRGIVQEVIMRGVDLVISLPPVLLGLLVLAVTPPGWARRSRPSAWSTCPSWSASRAPWRSGCWKKTSCRPLGRAAKARCPSCGTRSCPMPGRRSSSNAGCA